ncbi:MAG: dienelactone hydrolase family protein [Planctomycetes bacterium]|jgi:carboxymethylenebutenolidase|nr:dienelactone hydrolase family protein [Planctomycetota bacterium]
MAGTWVELGGTLRGFAARPARDSRAGVVVLQEIFGVNGHIRAVAENLARMGYVTIAPELFHRVAPGFDAGYDARAVAVGRKYREACTADGILADVKAAADWLRAQGCTRVGVVGFCFGGHAAWLAGTLDGIAACACFYGGGIGRYRPGGGPPSVDLAPKLKARMLMIYAEKDTIIEPAEVEQVAQALRQAGVPHEVHLFAGVGHGFACDERDDFDADAANMAWLKVFELLARELKAGA